jgi:phosphoribosylformimino-5-aminoimidazole carboxamide ribonucleotide (ProFAR) isomerase
MQFIAQVFAKQGKLLHYRKEPETISHYLIQKNISSIQFEDIDGEEMQAPQNVELLHRLLGTSKIPVRYAGGIMIAHHAELLITLGVSEVIVDKGLFLTERSPEKFSRILGDALVARLLINDFSITYDVIETLKKLSGFGVHKVLFRTSVTDVTNQKTPSEFIEILESFEGRKEIEFKKTPVKSNLETLISVGVLSCVVPFAKLAVK